MLKTHAERKFLIRISLLFLVIAAAGLFIGPAMAAVVGNNDHRLSDVGGLGTASTHVAVNPAIAFNSTNNEFLTVWEGTEGSDASEQRRIYAQRIDTETGAELGTNDFVSGEVPGAAAIDKDARDPAVAYNSTANEYLITFQGEPTAGSGSEPEVYGQRVNAATGALIGSAFLISDCGAPGNASADVGAAFGYPQDVVYNATNNEYLVVWRCDDVGDGGIINGEFEIHGQIVSATGTLVLAGDIQISETAGANGANQEYDAESPKAAYDSVNNQYLVVWGADNPTLGDGNREIHGQCLTDVGVQFGTNDFQISTTAHGGTKDSAVSDVVYNPTQGEYMVVWEGDITTDGTVDIYRQRVDDGVSCGSLVGGNTQIGQTASATEPSIDYNSVDNEYLVTWNATLAGGEREIFAQRLSSTGAEIGDNDIRLSDLGPDSNVNFGAGDFSNSIAYAGGSLNSYYAVWSGDDNRGGQVDNENEIFGQFLDPVLEVEKTITTTPLTGVDGFDVIRYTITVSHKQVSESSTTYDVSLRDALNIDVSDTLPAVLTNVTLVSAVVNPGATDVSGAFNVTGNTLSTTGDVDLHHGTVNGTDHETLTIEIEGTVANTVSPADIIAANTVAVEWDNSDTTDHPEYDDTATSGTATVAAAFSVTKTADVSQAAPGDTVTYQLEVEVIEGTTTNLVFDDTLPADMTYVAASAQVSNANGMTINGFTDNSGGDITIGSVVNPGNVNDTSTIDTDSFFITYQATVNAGVPAGTNLINDVDANADNVPADDNNIATVKVIAPPGGTLTVTKVVINDNGGLAVVGNFPLFIDGNPVSSGVATTVDAGAHVVSETNQPGYAATFSGDCDASGNVTVGLGESKTCTITNDDLSPQTGTIIINKVTDPAGAPDQFDFTGALGDFTLTDGGSQTFNTLQIGTYDVTESVPAGWSLDGIVCDDPSGGTTVSDPTAEIDLALGETVICTFTNTPTGDVTIEKTQTADDTVLPGETFFYELTIQNTYDGLVDMLITDTLSGDLDYVDDSLNIFKDGGLIGGVDDDAVMAGDILNYTTDMTGVDLLKIAFEVKVRDLVDIDVLIKNMAFVTVFYYGTGVVIGGAESNEVQTEVVPEPATVALLGVGLVGVFVALIMRRRWRRKQ
ncbi:MAG: isopeptide-forming domain-containing fimbrial protein [bacterium]|nr:isopeptide-forming domain-containing fimbrial protein [bacterium]